MTERTRESFVAETVDWETVGWLNPTELDGPEAEKVEGCFLAKCRVAHTSGHCIACGHSAWGARVCTNNLNKHPAAVVSYYLIGKVRKLGRLE